MLPILGRITLLPYDFAPPDWSTCNGQMLAIAENDVLFNLLGTRFGGDGRQNINLPDLRCGAKLPPTAVT